ncbi:MAG: chemotaxis protein CheW [Acidobacteriota bacterium]
MEQPWPPPQQPAPDADDLPLAGLLAELLAASEAEPAPPPEGDPVAALAQPSGWPQSEPEAGLDPAQVLRALDEASQPTHTPDPDDFSGALLARLMDGDEPGGMMEAACPAPEQTGLAAPGVPSPEVPPVPAISEAAVAEADATSAGQPAALLARLLEEDEPAAVADTAAIVPDEAEIPAPEAAMEEAVPAAASRLEASPAGPESGITGDAEIQAARHDAWPEQASAGPDEVGAAAAALEPAEARPSAGAAPDSIAAPAGRRPATPANDEDEFELVDAAQAEKMLDRLLDAARSAIRSTQEPAPGAASPHSVRTPVVSRPPQADGGLSPAIEPGPELAGNCPPAGPASIEGRKEALPAAQAPEEELWMREPGRRRNAEDRSAEVSPIPPAAALMALGLPERLRARLESLGDIERILKPHAALEAAPERKPRLLVFRAGGESYALSMECVREVERVSRVTPVPGAPPFVRGLVNLRGEILPLLDLAALFGRKGETPAPRLIVAQASSADPVVALMVEELNGLAPFHETEVEPPPQPGPVRGSLEHRDRRVWWIDPVAVFGSEALEKAACAGQRGGVEESE